MKDSVRTPARVFFASITALTIRDIQKRFITHVNARRSISFLWIFIEPLAHIIAWSAARSMTFAKFSGGIAAPLFIMVGAIMLLFTRNVIKSASKAIIASKNLYIFRQIIPIDPIIAYVISEALVISSVFMVLLLSFWWVGISFKLSAPFFLIGNFLVFALYLLGISISMAVIGFFFNFINVTINPAMRILYFTSGVFFTADMIPAHLRVYFLYNPLFQIIEICRECFTSAQSTVHYGDPIYLAKCCLVSMFIGFTLYIAFRKRIMIEVEQR
jgi:capsular polysaccharide transport system permease protein